MIRLDIKLNHFHSDRSDTYWKLWKSQCPHPINNSNLTLKKLDLYCKEHVTPHLLHILTKFT